jgi:hypothetical protein
MHWYSSGRMQHVLIAVDDEHLRALLEACLRRLASFRSLLEYGPAFMNASSAAALAAPRAVQ